MAPINPIASPLRDILDMARWAPSGDNAQPWRFEVLDDRHVVIHGRDTRDSCVYDLRGHASYLAHGALLETLSIAASEHGFWLRAARRKDTANPATFDAYLEPNHNVRRDPLYGFITQRCTQRRAVRASPLTDEQRTALEASASSGGNFDLRWRGSFGQRWDIAWLLFRSAWIRLTIPEGYRTHRDAIEWNARYSRDRLPDQAIGLDPLTTRLMQWVMQSWDRVSFMNKYLAGTLAPRVQLDLIPGLCCGAHVAVLAPKRPASIDDFVDAGRAVQRLWLQATALGLQFQPEMTPLIFRNYVRDGVEFTVVSKAQAAAARLADRFDNLFGRETADRIAFVARIGQGLPPLARSLRLPLARLLHQS